MHDWDERILGKRHRSYSHRVVSASKITRQIPVHFKSAIFRSSTQQPGCQYTSATRQVAASHKHRDTRLCSPPELEESICELLIKFRYRLCLNRENVFLARQSSSQWLILRPQDRSNF